LERGEKSSSLPFIRRDKKTGELEKNRGKRNLVPSPL
jgi:hypothetical protein